MTDQQLLRQFVQDRSQAAFSQIVARHLNFVYTVCRRETGDAGLAEDVTQVVFLIFARRAATLHVETSLSGWLFQTARFASKNARRREAHRKGQEREMQERNAQEQAASVGQDENSLWGQVEPHFNSALAALSAKDREAVLLRFADGLSFPELSQALGTSEDAARMRLNRAVSRLRQSFANAGITVSAAVLAALLAERTVQAAPPASVALLAKLGNSGAAVSPQVSFHLQGAIKAMTLSKITLTAAVALATVAVVSVPFVTRAQNSAVPSSASPMAVNTVPHGKPQSAAAGAALAMLNALQLSGPFKLHYSVVTTDVSTPEMKAAALNALKRSYTDNVKVGYMTQAAADEGLRQYIAYKASQPRVSRFDIVFASDGNKLFYKKTEAGDQVTVIYDGSRTFDCDSRFKHTTKLFDHISSSNYILVDSGLKLGEMPFYPVPGAAFPHIALLQQSAETPTSRGLFVKGNVPTMNAGIQYQRGEIALTDDAGKTRISAMTGFFGGRNFPSERWEFLRGQPFQGIIIASEIRFTSYDSPELVPEESHYQKPFLPATVTEYQLISADTSLSPSQFDPAAYLSPGDQVRENTPDNKTRAFFWHPGLKLD